nr:tryptophan--tRNA ligase [Candidatus Sigynarchaeota archaeon]
MNDESTVTPWEVTGNVDYEKLIKQFGVERIDSQLLKRIERKAGELHPFLRRGIFFSHRDMNWLLDEFERENMLENMLDVIALGFNPKLHENMLDVIALGFNPKKTHFLVDTLHAKSMYKPACEVAKRITLSTIKSSFGFNDSVNLGQIFYTAMQSVPAFFPSYLAGKNIPCLIPHAIDQDPHFRLARDILPKMGYYKPAAIHSVFLPPLTGPGGKMSSSISTSAVYTIDSPKVMKDKIMKYAFSGGQASIKEHREKGGNPDIDVSYQWLRFFEDDDNKLKKIHDDYKNGKLLTGELKQILVEKLSPFLERHQEARAKAGDKIEDYMFHE